MWVVFEVKNKKKKQKNRKSRGHSYRGGSATAQPVTRGPHGAGPEDQVRPYHVSGKNKKKKREEKNAREIAHRPISIRRTSVSGGGPADTRCCHFDRCGDPPCAWAASQLAGGLARGPPAPTASLMTLIRRGRTDRLPRGISGPRTGAVPRDTFGGSEKLF